MKDIENIIFGCCLINYECFAKLNEYGNIFLKLYRYYDSLVEIHESDIKDNYLISDVFQKNKIDYGHVLKILESIEYEHQHFDRYLEKYLNYYSEKKTEIYFNKFRNKEISLDELQIEIEKNVLIKKVESSKSNMIDIINDENFDKHDEFIDIGIPFFQNGFSKEELIIIAARPGIGKTTLMRNWNIKAGIKNFPICIYELEVPKKKYTKQMLCTIASVNHELYSAGLLNEIEKQRIEIAQRFFVDRKIIVRDMTDGIGNIDKMILDMKKQVKNNGVKMFFIDYLQLVRCNHGNKRNEQVGYISRAFKLFASEYLTPVIALAQLNREIENRTNQDPRLSDLKDSGDIEQDADTIMFLTDIKIPGKFTSRIKHIIAKRRNGAPGFYFSNFEKATGAMTEIEIKNNKEFE